ncbi:hypothetical protein XA68_11960 [Ophiocordyceps unilateralis]|uniref:Uncharacterized protein n=1 Tax=Ophiocordyceps unilateralis TaxID=268505 RepID=A0A2A9PET7_OPHUN|nr:hypothetical protein XA68_11960 [Ophiocordyceps unilateralis]
MRTQVSASWRTAFLRDALSPGFIEKWGGSSGIRYSVIVSLPFAAIHLGVVCMAARKGPDDDVYLEVYHVAATSYHPSAALHIEI